MLKEQDYDVTVAINAAEAEKRIKESRPDLILLDVMMPEEDGYSFGRRLKSDERYFDIPILMLSAKNTDEDIKRGIDICADDYLPKPFNSTILISKIKALLRYKNIIDEMKVFSNSLLKKIEKQDLLRKYLSKETLFFTQLNKTLYLQEKSDIIKQLLPDILEIELFSIFLIDGGKLKVFSHNHEEICSAIEIESIKQSPMYKAVSTQSPELIEDFNATQFYRGSTRSKYKKKSSIIFPLIIHGKCIGVVNMNNRAVGEFDIQFLERATRMMEHIANSIETSLLFQQLTRAYSRRYFFNLLAVEIKKYARYKHNFCILMMDIDNFKKFNDTYGHLNGDKLLRRFSDIVRKHIRDTDYFGRYGGEEFVVLLTETPIDGGIILAERIRNSVEKDCIIEANGKLAGVTVSGGLAEYRLDLSEEEILAEADNNLYFAKKNGKNQIIHRIEV